MLVVVGDINKIELNQQQILEKINYKFLEIVRNNTKE